MFHEPKKYGRYLLAAVFALFVFKNPVAAAHMAQQAGGLLMQAADAAGKFAAAFE